MATDNTQKDGFLRLEQIIGTNKAVNNTPKRPLKRERREHYEPLIPVSRGTWYNGIKDGRFPAGVRLSPRVVVWRAADIFKLIQK